MQKKFSILMASAECAPFVKVGGLGDVLGSLPQAIAHTGAHVSVILPLYGSIDRKKYNLKKLPQRVHIKRHHKKEAITIFTAKLPHNPVTYYFVEHAYFASKKIYIHKKRYPVSGDAYTRSLSDVQRFSWFSEAVVEISNQLKLNPDIIHCHDWHAALIPTFVDQLAVTKFYPFTKTILTIHNLANQGVTYRDFIRKISLEADTTPSLLEDYYDLDDEHLNLMKLGILSADAVTTVSQAYAKEILTTEYGAGLEKYLTRRRSDLYGILNGIDINFFDPQTDTFIKKRYGAATWQKNKPLDKKDLQKKLGLPLVAAPLYGMVTRIVHQKGFDILLQALPKMLSENMQFVVLGTGDTTIESALKKIAVRYPEKMRVITTFDIELAQKIYAGSDFFVMPSKYEPCGLGQMIAMRYGSIPIVHAVGGLKDTIHHLKTGILFATYKADGLAKAFRLSQELYADKKTWYTIVRNIMHQDFSWKRSADEYIKLYKKIL